MVSLSSTRLLKTGKISSVDVPGDSVVVIAVNSSVDVMIASVVITVDATDVSIDLTEVSIGSVNDVDLTDVSIELIEVAIGSANDVESTESTVVSNGIVVPIIADSVYVNLGSVGTVTGSRFIRTDSLEVRISSDAVGSTIDLMEVVINWVVGEIDSVEVTVASVVVTVDSVEVKIDCVGVTVWVVCCDVVGWILGVVTGDRVGMSAGTLRKSGVQSGRRGNKGIMSHSSESLS